MIWGSALDVILDSNSEHTVALLVLLWLPYEVYTVSQCQLHKSVLCNYNYNEPVILIFCVFFYSRIKPKVRVQATRS